MIISVLVVSVLWIPLSTGSGICTKTIREPVITTVKFKKSFLSTHWGICRWYGVNNRCVKSSVVYKDDLQRKINNVTKIVQYCCDGYKQKSTAPIECIPHCEQNCYNGYCDKPGTCRCNNGFALVNGTCIAACTHGCVNSKCIKPEICECLKGYTKQTRNKCIPTCNPPCEKSRCLAPDKCMCDHGYKLDVNNKHICVPDCNKPCTNGVCVAPNQCECNNGYKLNQTIDLCVPVCSQPCINSNCTQPETCECYNGYEKLTNTTCIPHCSKFCQYGTCVAPEKCNCLQGYIQDPLILNKCNPKCAQDCINGKCVSPDTCQCLEGDEPDGPFSCKPICSNGCNNADCIAPEMCACWDGYEKSKVVNTCVPKCNDSCVNGVCNAPDKCTCLEGYTKSNVTNICIPFCSLECTFGECTAPETCTCNPGYTFQNNFSQICIPLCSNPCENGFCAEPEKCLCNEGYIMTNKSSEEEGDCVPLCEKCINGYCSAPQKCNCYEGFKLNLKNNQCEPICQNICTNGYVTEFGACKCFEGYTFSDKNQTCKQFCNHNSTNETCLEHNYLHNLCEPICIGGCEKGECIRPNICSCNYPFISNPLNGSQCSLDYKYSKQLNYSSPEYILRKNITSVVNPIGFNKFVIHWNNVNMNLELECNSSGNKKNETINFICWQIQTKVEKISIVCSIGGLQREGIIKLDNNDINSKNIYTMFHKENELIDLDLALLIPETLLKGENELCSFCLKNNIINNTFSLGKSQKVIFVRCMNWTNILGTGLITLTQVAFGIAASLVSFFLTLLTYLFCRRAKWKKINMKNTNNSGDGALANTFVNAAYEFQLKEPSGNNH